MKIKHVRLLAFAAVAVMAFGTAMWVCAGTTGIVSGVVKNAADGTPVAGANIIITGTQLSTVTDANGYFVITNVPPGEYEVRAEMVGFATEPIAGIQVTMDTTASVDFDLAQEAIPETEAVVVRPRPMINPDVTSTLNLVSAGQENLARTDPASVRTVPGVISSFPGVMVDPNGSGQMHLRGGRSDQVGYYLEGIPLTDPNTGLFSTNLFTTGVNKFQMYPGGFGAEYGNAISGVLNEVKKTGSQFQGFGMDAEGGTDSFLSGFGQVGGETPSGFNYYVGTSMQQTDLDGPLVTEQEYADNVVKMVWPSRKNTFTLLGLQGSLVGWFNPTEFTRQRYNIGGVTWSHSFTPDSFLTVQPYYIYSTTVLSTGYGGQDAASEQSGLQVGYTNQLNERHLLKLGGSMLSSNNDNHVDFPGYAFYQYDSNVDTFQTALYAEDEMKFGDKWTLTAGLRSEGIRYNRNGLAYLPGSGYTGDPLSDISENRTTPRFGLSFAQDERTVWKANWGKYTKFIPAVSVQHVYFDPDDPYAEGMQAGLGATEPQESTAYELSFEKQFSDSLSVRATPFHAKYTNLVQTQMDMDTGLMQYSSLGMAKSSGLELLARKRLNSNWEGWLSYTYAKSKANSGGDFDPIAGSSDALFYAPWDQRHSVSLVTNYTNGKWAHGLRADFGSGRADIVGAGAAALQDRAKPYFVLTYNVSMKSNANETFYLNIYNLFNTHQTLQYSNDGSTRSRDSWIPGRFLSFGTSRSF